MKTNKNPRISNEQFKTELVKAISEGNAMAYKKTSFFELLRTTYSIMKQRSFNLFDLYYPEIMKEINEKAIAESAEQNSEAIANLVGDKNKHAQELLEDIERLKQITTGKALKVANQLIIATFTDELRAKGEIRAIRKQIGEWYGFNTPKQINQKTQLDIAPKPLQKVKLIIQEYNPGIDDTKPNNLGSHGTT